MIDNITESKLHVALSVFPFSSSQAVRASLTRTAHLQKLFTLDTLHFCVFASCISDFNLAEFYKWIYFYMNYSQQIQGRSSILKLQLCNLLLVTRWPLGCEFRPPFPSLCSCGITDRWTDGVRRTDKLSWPQILFLKQVTALPAPSGGCILWAGIVAVDSWSDPSSRHLWVLLEWTEISV